MRVFAYAKSRFSHDMAHTMNIKVKEKLYCQYRQTINLAFTFPQSQVMMVHVCFAAKSKLGTPLVITEVKKGSIAHR